MKKCNHVTNKISGKLGRQGIVLLLALILCGVGGGMLAADTYADAPTLTLSVSTDNLSFNLMPNKETGVFASSDTMTIGVTMTGTGGYTVGIKAASSNNLVNTVDNTKTLSSIDAAVSETDFAADSSAGAAYNGKWGYLPSMYNSAANTDYLPTPGTAGHIIEERKNVSDVSGTYTIKIGARAGLNTEPGVYEGAYIITAIVNTVCNPNATTIWEAVCMQDMNDNVANSMEVHKQYVLMDSRDNKNYYVAKMNDGRVWMTQNLDFDIPTTGVTSEKTDLNNSGSAPYADGYATSGGVITWTPERATGGLTGWASDYNNPYSYDDNRYAYTNAGGTTTTYNDKASCEAAHSDGTCAHYHTGNYYNFTAAVASNNSSGVTSGVQANSICPKGWRLPNNSANYGDANQTWLAEGITTGIVTAAEHYGLYLPNGYNKISQAPLYLTRTGSWSSVNAPGLGTNGYYRTGQLNDATYAWTYYFTPTYAYPYERYATTGGIWFTRAYGAPVRCLARQSNTGGTTTVSFSANNASATGATGVTSIAAGSSKALTANGFSVSGYVFNGWNTAADGSGTTYTDKQVYYAAVGTNATNVTLYAQWAPAHTITVNAGTGLQAKVSTDNGASWHNVASGASDSVTAGEGQTVILTAVDGTPGTVFNNWAKTTGAGDFVGTQWRSAETKTTAFVVGAGDATITANGTTTYKTIADANVTMQEVTACPDWLGSTIYTVTDTRDGGDTYKIQKLNDGKCWMLDNLELGNNSSTVALTPSDTNITSNYTLPKGITSGFGTYASGQINAAYEENVSPTKYGSGGGKVGVYYNYCAASAGTVCTSGDDAIDAPVDICPAGWRMPTGGAVNVATGQGEYQALYSAYSSNATNFRNALSTPLSGYFVSATQSFLGSYGYFWASTMLGGGVSYGLVVYSSGVYPQDGNIRDGGFSMRCVLGG